VTDYQHIIDTVTLIMGSKGVFDVKVDEETIFSKKALGRHAQPGEVLQLFKELVGPDVPTYPRSE
jgi:selenoprotein W-related protein